MPAIFRHRRFRPAFGRGVVWLMLVALPLCGLSVRLLEMLGPRHLHHAPVAGIVASAGMAGWQDFRRGGGAEPASPHGHRHGLLDRHRHDAGDPTVVALDDATGELDGTGVALGALAFAVAGAAGSVPGGGKASGAWPPGAATRFRSRASTRLDRPPCA